MATDNQAVEKLLKKEDNSQDNSIVERKVENPAASDLEPTHPEKLLILSKGIKVANKPRIHFDIDHEGRKIPCVVGYNGIKQDKKEGDGGTPIGTFPLRQVWYRADKIDKPVTDLPTRVITQNDGWCDDSSSPLYNRWVDLSKPFTKSHEKLWLENDLYDIIVEIGYNDETIEKGKGSAIFMHVARPNFTPTDGCVALKLSDLKELLQSLKPGSEITIKESGISVYSSPRARNSA